MSSHVREIATSLPSSAGDIDPRIKGPFLENSLEQVYRAGYGYKKAWSV
jgi:hypothetical protein